MAVQRVHVLYSGTVQAVGFRYRASGLSDGRSVSGYVRNLSDGRVELVAEGERAEVDGFLAALRAEMAGLIRHEDVSWHPASDEFARFDVRF